MVETVGHDKIQFVGAEMATDELGSKLAPLLRISVQEGPSLAPAYRRYLKFLSDPLPGLSRFIQAGGTGRTRQDQVDLY